MSVNCLVGELSCSRNNVDSAREFQRGVLDDYNMDTEFTPSGGESSDIFICTKARAILGGSKP